MLTFEQPGTRHTLAYEQESKYFVIRLDGPLSEPEVRSMQGRIETSYGEGMPAFLLLDCGKGVSISPEARAYWAHSGKAQDRVTYMAIFGASNHFKLVLNLLNIALLMFGVRISPVFLQDEVEGREWLESHRLRIFGPPEVWPQNQQERR